MVSASDSAVNLGVAAPGGHSDSDMPQGPAQPEAEGDEVGGAHRAGPAPAGVGIRPHQEGARAQNYGGNSRAPLVNSPGQGGGERYESSKQTPCQNRLKVQI